MPERREAVTMVSETGGTGQLSSKIYPAFLVIKTGFSVMF